MNLKKYYMFIGAMAAVSAAVIVTSYFVRLDPARDQVVSNDISSLASNIDGRYLSSGKLPAALAEVEVTEEGLRERSAKYEYRRLSDTKYQICATFKTKHRTYDTTTYDIKSQPDPSQHDAGFQCFVYTVEPIAKPFSAGTND